VYVLSRVTTPLFIKNTKCNLFCELCIIVILKQCDKITKVVEMSMRQCYTLIVLDEQQEIGERSSSSYEDANVR